MMYKNLKAEMAKNSVRGKDIAKVLGTRPEEYILS